MNILKSLSFMLILLALVGTSSVYAQDEDEGLERLPDLELKNLDNKTVNVSSYGENGKITVFSFWAATKSITIEAICKAPSIPSALERVNSSPPHCTWPIWPPLWPTKDGTWSPTSSETLGARENRNPCRCDMRWR